MLKLSSPLSHLTNALSLHFHKPHHFLYTKKISRLTKNECIVYLQNCKSMKELKQIQSQIFRSGLSQNRDTLNRLIFCCTDSDFGNLLYALRIFNYIQDPCIFIYNLLIKAFTKKGIVKTTLSMFNRLRESGLSPDNFTFPFALKAIGRLRVVSEGRKVHGFIVRSGFEFDPYVRNSLMDMYADMGCIDNVRQLFEEIVEKDIVCWNTLISGYVKCRRFEDAVAVFGQMGNETGVWPDEATVVSTLSACVALGSLELGKEIHGYVSTELGFTNIIGNALIDMYAKCGCLSLARQVFDEMQVKTVISWTSVVSGYVNCGNLDEARKLFERSPTKDVILWTTMINGYVQFNRFDEALDLFQHMQMRRVKPDRFTVVALLTGCAQLGALEQGRWIHGYIEENNIMIDTVVGTALIDMYAKCGCIDKSMEIFGKIGKKDTASWTAIVCGLAMNGLTNKALMLFLEMQQLGYKPDDVTFVGVLSACSHGGLVEEGRRYFDCMKMIYQIEPKVEHYGCLVDLLGRAGLLDEAEALIEEIPDVDNEALLPLWGALLSACRIHGKVETGQRVAEHLSRIKSNDSGIQTLVANLYAAGDRWEDVTKVRRKMKDLGVRKMPGCSSIEVNGTVQEFLVGDTLHPKASEVYSILNDMTCLLFDSQEVLRDDII